MSNLGIFLLFGNFLKNGLITFLYFCKQLLGDDIDQLSRDGFDLIIGSVIVKVGKVGFRFNLIQESTYTSLRRYKIE